MYVYALRSVSGPLLDSADYADSAHAEIRRNDRVSRLYFRITRRVCTRLSPAAPFDSNTDALDSGFCPLTGCKDPFHERLATIRILDAAHYESSQLRVADQDKVPFLNTVFRARTYQEGAVGRCAE